MLTRAASEDEADLTRVIEASFVEYVRVLGRDWPGPYSWLAQAILDGRVFWIGDRQGVLVASLEDGAMVIDQIGIAPQHRGRGLGRITMEDIEARARAGGLKELRLFTAQPHTHLVAFYSSLGFEVTDIRPPPAAKTTSHASI